MKRYLFISMFSGLTVFMSWFGGAMTPAYAAFPTCPENTNPATIDQWRSDAMRAPRGAPGSVARTIESCFSTVPACLKRLYDRSLTELGALNQTAGDETEEEKQIHMLPPEFRDTQGNQVLWIKQPNGTYKSIIDIAKERGWPMVRYKSRHAGGFDHGSSSLVMIRITGSSFTPPIPYDRYVNIALPPDSGEGTQATRDVNPSPARLLPTPEEMASGSYPRVFTIVAVKKKQGAAPAKVYFSKFQRPLGTSSYFNASGALGSCYGCHPNGLRAISPLGFHVNSDENQRGQVLPDNDWKAVQEMNNSMNSNMGYRPPSWGQILDGNGVPRELLNPEGLGPVIGPVKPLTRTNSAGGMGATVFPTRTKEFIVGADGLSGCANAVTEISVRDIFDRSAGKDNVYKLTRSPPIDWQKVSNAMKCATCHNNEIRGALNAKNSFSMIQFKILVDQSMPVGSHRNPLDQQSTTRSVQDELNSNERIALANCLKTEFAQEQQHADDWLRQISCSNIAQQNVTGYGQNQTTTEGTYPGTVSPQAISNQNGGGMIGGFGGTPNTTQNSPQTTNVIPGN